MYSYRLWAAFPDIAIMPGHHSVFTSRIEISSEDGLLSIEADLYSWREYR